MEAMEPAIIRATGIPMLRLVPVLQDLTAVEATVPVLGQAPSPTAVSTLPGPSQLGVSIKCNA